MCLCSNFDAESKNVKIYMLCLSQKDVGALKHFNNAASCGLWVPFRNKTTTEKFSVRQ